MEACDTWIHLHTTQEIKYKNLVTVTQKVWKMCEKKQFGSKFVVYKKMGTWIHKLLERQMTNKQTNKNNYYGTAVERNKITLRLSTIKVDVRATFFQTLHWRQSTTRVYAVMPDICAWKATHLVRHTYVHCLDKPVNETIQYTEYATSMSTLLTHGSKAYGT
jgi:hypothetical protein